MGDYCIIYKPRTNRLKRKLKETKENSLGLRLFSIFNLGSTAEEGDLKCQIAINTRFKVSDLEAVLRTWLYPNSYEPKP